MAHSTRRAVAPPRKVKPRRKQLEDEGVFEDVVALDYPREILAGPFRVALPLDGRRREPNPVIKPKAEED